MPRAEKPDIECLTIGSWHCFVAQKITDKPVAKGPCCQVEHIALRFPLRLLVVSNDDAVRRPRESIQSGRTPALAQDVALDCPFPVPSASDSDDSSPGI